MNDEIICKYICSRGESKGKYICKLTVFNNNNYCRLHNKIMDNRKPSCKYTFTKGNKKGLLCSCKIYDGVYCKEHYNFINNRDNIIEYHKNYYINNRDELLIQQKIRDDKNKEAKLIYQNENKDRLRLYNKTNYKYKKLLRILCFMRFIKNYEDDRFIIEE
jgi:hypothetical protein